MVSSRNELCVTARGDNDQTLYTTDSTIKRPCVTEVKDRKPCTTVSRRSELCVTARVEEDGGSTPRKGNYGSAGSPLVAKMAANPKVRVKRSGKMAMRQCWNYHWTSGSNRTERRITRPNQHLHHPQGGSSKSIEGLGGGKNAIQENNWKVEEITGIQEVGKVVDGNFIRVMIGGEPYLAL